MPRGGAEAFRLFMTQEGLLPADLRIAIEQALQAGMETAQRGRTFGGGKLKPLTKGEYKAIYQAKREMHEWFEMPPEAQLQSMLGPEGGADILSSRLFERGFGLDDPLAFLRSLGHRFRSTWVDDSHAVLALERRLGRPLSDGAWQSIRRLASIPKIVEGLWERGALAVHEGGRISFVGEGLRDALDPIKATRAEPDRSARWFRYAVARQAQHLFGQGREKLLGKTQIESGLAEKQPENFIEIHPRDARRRGIEPADMVEVSPPFDVGGITALNGATVMFELLCVMAG